jgi:hypothetical protein
MNWYYEFPEMALKIHILAGTKEGGCNEANGTGSFTSREAFPSETGAVYSRLRPHKLKYDSSTHYPSIWIGYTLVTSTVLWCLRQPRAIGIESAPGATSRPPMSTSLRLSANRLITSVVQWLFDANLLPSRQSNLSRL